MGSRATSTVQIGRWGRLDVEPGYYLYVGSAFGPGGVAARVTRHLRKRKPRRWHLDYLRAHVIPAQIWICYDPERREHPWATAVGNSPCVNPIEGFGSSDCRCRAHLFRIKAQADLEWLSTVLPGVETDIVILEG